MWIDVDKNKVEKSKEIVAGIYNLLPRFVFH